MAQLNFKGKQFVQNHHLVVPYHELIPQKGKSLTEKVSLHDNLIIHGDNLLALKALLPTYAGKVKCIYIDPPYNTGNEKWIYNDNVNSPMMQEWLKSNTPVDKDDLTRHDKWLCMMTPRLKLLKELLRDDGVIFISIDDNEVHHLRMLMDEIFGEENLLVQQVWLNREGGGSSDSKYFKVKHEYIISYAKNLEYLTIEGLEITNLDRYKLSDDHIKVRGRHYLQKMGMSSIQYSLPLDYQIKAPNGNLIKASDNANGEKACWRWSKDKFEWGILNDFIVIKKDNNNIWTVYTKQYLKVDNENNPINRTQRPTGVIEKFSSTQASKDMKEIFPENTLVFSYPKSTELIQYILKLVNGTDEIILDSFAGSGTTAHATLQLNKKDRGNRKFILVEMEDYADNITAERVRRVIKGYSDKEGTGGTFSYFDLGKPIEIESLLSGKNLPSYNDLARYVYYTATGEEFDDSKVDEKRNFIGESENYEIFLFYKPDLEYLKNTALTLDRAKTLGNINGKRRLVFAPTKYLDQENLDELQIDFAQLPFEIYKLAK